MRNLVSFLVFASMFAKPVHAQYDELLGRTFQSWREIAALVTEPAANQASPSCAAIGHPSTALLMANGSRGALVAAWVHGWTPVQAPTNHDTLSVRVLGYDCSVDTTLLRVLVHAGTGVIGIPATQIPTVDAHALGESEPTMGLLADERQQPLYWTTYRGKPLGLYRWSALRDSAAVWDVQFRKDSARETAMAREAQTAARAANRRAAAAERAHQQAEVKRIRAEYSRRGWSGAIIDEVLSQRVSIGMTPDMVRASWGAPEHINRTVTAAGTSEQWVYGVGTYVYVENGRVTAIQDQR